LASIFLHEEKDKACENESQKNNEVASAAFLHINNRGIPFRATEKTDNES
jgi:hypothetical protein